MGLRNIVTLPEPVLRRKARPVGEFDAELQELIEDMIDTMRAAPGVGLAAPQVEDSRRVIVVEYAEEDEAEPDEPAEPIEPRPEPKPRLFVLVNPEIVKASEETVLGVEGCLSIPGVVGEVERNQSIQVRGLNRRGRPIKVKAEGWLARIFQHEVDHLNGVLFPDRALRVWRPEPEDIEKDERV
jgi:peptide deformylase